MDFFLLLVSVLLFLPLQSARAATRTLPTIQREDNVRVLPTAIPTPTFTRRILIQEETPTPTQEPIRIRPLSPTPTGKAYEEFTRKLDSRPSPTPTPTAGAIKFRRIATDSSRLLLTEVTLAQTSTKSGIPVRIERKDEKGTMTFDIEGTQRTLPVSIDFDVEKGTFFPLDGSKNRMDLALSPPSFYAAILAAFKKNHAQLDSIELKESNGSPIYELTITENFKLFGIFSYPIKKKLTINARTNTPDQIDYSFLEKLGSHPNWPTLLQSGPNFSLTNVHFEPLSYKTGQKVVLWADLVNTGTQKAYSGVGTHVTNWLYTKADKLYGTDEQVLDLDPGESQKLAYVINSVECGAPLSIIFDTNRVLKEIDDKTVWYGTATCAPNNGPDLTVTQIKFDGLSYGGKNPGVENKVSYTIKNIGNGDSEPVVALAKAGPGQFLNLISVPLIKPGGIYSGSFNYIPTTCDPVDISIDTQGKMKDSETNRDNNDVFEDQQITNWCNALPQLQFDRVYWMANGYSFGKSKYPNGSIMSFEVDTGNLSWDITVGCATLVKIRVTINGQVATDVPVGTVGNCPNGGSHTTGDNAHMLKTTKFTIGPACGADVQFTLDPDHFNPELDRGNNTWTTKVECE